MGSGAQARSARASAADWLNRWTLGLIDAFATSMMLVAAVALAAALTTTVSTLFPGVHQWDGPSWKVYVVAGTSVVAAGLVGLFAASVPVNDHLVKPRAIGSRLVADVGQFVDDLGMTGGRRHPARMLCAGVLAGIVTVAQLEASMRWPALAATATGPDVRVEALLDAPAWVQVLYFASVSPLWEEVAFRGGLLLLVAYLSRRVARPPLRRALVATAIVLTAFAFGAGHAHFSILNAVTAGVGGLLFGAVAVWARSIWPAVIAHTMLNLWAGINLAANVAGA